MLKNERHLRAINNNSSFFLNCLGNDFGNNLIFKQLGKRIEFRAKD